jgi:hypothetical protein
VTTPTRRYYHGGIADLRVGDLITPGVDGHRRHHDGCPICRARNNGQVAPLDPTPDRHGVYLTADREYARYYASLTGRGDLYVVDPVGDVQRSSEDHFDTVIAPAARVWAVYERAVQLTDGQRRRLLARWLEADADAEGWGDRLRAMSPADRRRLLDRQYAALLRDAARLVGGRS